MADRDPDDGGGPSPAQPGRVYLTTLRHDLRAPVGAIIGYADLLLEDRAGREETTLFQDLAKIQASGRSLLAMVDELFDPAAIAAGTLDLGAVGSHLRHDLRTPLNHVIGYSEMLAEEARDEGREELATDLMRIRGAGLRILSMLDDVLARAADPSAAVADAPGDLNPGLSDVAVEVVEDLESFQARVAGADEAPGRILVVDDNELNRDMLARRVRGQGHTVEVADGGVRGLELLATQAFDVVLLDIVMPGMNGYEVLRRMKSDPDLHDVPVIMISALDEVESAVRCIEMGAEDYLPKPFNPTLLRARLGACLEKKRLRDREVLHLQRIEEEQRRSDALLHVILPAAIVKELKETTAVRPRRYDDVALLFSDIVGFTPYAEHREPEEVIANLQRLVQAQEEITAGLGMEKIKTIGDAFMAAAGLLHPLENPVRAAVRCGLAMIEAAHELPPHWELRVGIHLGPLVGGVLGRRQYLFDVIGDTVNTAARVERAGAPGAVTLSGDAWSWIDGLARGRPLGRVEVKGKGPLPLVQFEGFLTDQAPDGGWEPEAPPPTSGDSG